MSFISKISDSIKSFTKGMKFFPLNGVNVINNDPFAFEFGRLSAMQKGYGQNPYAFTVINRIAERAVDIPSVIANENKEEVKNLNPFFNDVISNPNKEGLNETLYRAFANYLINELFIVESRSFGFDQMTGFFVPNYTDVYINQDAKGNVTSYNISYLGKTYTNVDPSMVLHIKRPDVTSQLLYGRGNMISGAPIYQANNEVWTSEASLHKNKGNAGVLYSDGNRPMTEKERKEHQDHYDKEFSGSSKFGKVKVSLSKLGYLQMGMNPTDLKSIESRIDHLRAFCSLYNVDPQLFGDPSGKTYNNMPMAKLGLITDAVIPMLNKIMGELVVWVSGKFNEKYCYLPDLENVPEMQASKKEMSDRLGKEVIQGILSPFQARNMLYPHLRNEDITPTENTGTAPVGDLLEILRSVQDGSVSRESATVIMMQIYGFSEQTINEILA